MKTRTLGRIGAVLLLGTLVVGATALTHATRSEASACPGTILCPLSGERICSDRCPLDGAAADECPGTIVCPLDAQTICKDRCPLAGDLTSSAPEAPACCPAEKSSANP